jgi:hypothetical protein
MSASISIGGLLDQLRDTLAQRPFTGTKDCHRGGRVPPGLLRRFDSLLHDWGALKGKPLRLEPQFKPDVYRRRRSRCSAGPVKHGNGSLAAETVEIVGRWLLLER